MTLSPAFAAILRAGRKDFNARVDEARRCYPAFSTELFNHFLTRCVDPLVSAMAPDRRGLLASAAFDVALDLVGRELCGAHARGEKIETLWMDVLPALTAHLFSQPAQQICVLCNALLNLFTQGARVEQWLQLIKQHGPSVSESALLELGLFAAWRCGAAQFRLAALDAAAKHPDIASQLLEIPNNTDFNEVLTNLKKDPWLLATKNASHPVREIGAFAGFGGAFGKPPVIRASREGFFIASDDRYFFLVVDALGEALLPANASEFHAAENYKATDRQGPNLNGSRVAGPRGEFDLNLCPDDLQMVWNEHSAAVFSPYSFSIFVVPWR